MFEKVVICLDGSKRAELILPYATEEALHFNSKLILLHVFTPSIGAAMSMTAAEQEQRQISAEEEKRKDYLESVAAPLREKGIDVECVVLQGEPSDEIVKYTKTTGTSLLAISTELKHGLMHTAFGKTTDFILKQSHVPVLLVKLEK
ncbi:MAG: universal stress protein [Dehalococcoidales bacterium]|nr:universal stress protein [Dehalococcoidales bacterium]